MTGNPPRSRVAESSRRLGPGGEPRWLSLDAILALHTQQVDRFGGSRGVLDRGAIEAALTRPISRFHYGGTSELAALAAAYLFAFAASHGFVAMLVFLAVNGRPLHVPPGDLYALAMDAATGRITEAQAAVWLRAKL